MIRHVGNIQRIILHESKVNKKNMKILSILTLLYCHNEKFIQRYIVLQIDVRFFLLLLVWLYRQYLSNKINTQSSSKIESINKTRYLHKINEKCMQINMQKLHYSIIKETIKFNWLFLNQFSNSPTVASICKKKTPSI